jgi:hypothetical protein
MRRKMNLKLQLPNFNYSTHKIIAMENNATSIETLFQRAEDYSKTTLMLLRLKAINKSANIVSFIAIRLILLMVVALFLTTFNIGLALWLGEILGKSYYGFFTVTAIYILVATLLYVFRAKLISTPVKNTVIVEMLKK